MADSLNDRRLRAERGLPAVARQSMPHPAESDAAAAAAGVRAVSSSFHTRIPNPTVGICPPAFRNPAI